jgi:xylulokinase
MGCWILTDHNNNPLTNIISWQDKRIGDEIPRGTSMMELAYQFYTKDSLQLSGNEVRQGLPVFGVYQFLKENSIKGSLRFHSLISWLSSQLVNDYPYIVHDTDFASSGMLNLETRKPLDGLLDLFNNRIVFPEVTNNFQSLGDKKSEKTKFYIGIGDQQASLYGAELRSDTIVLNIGTGGQVATLKPTIGTLDKAQTRPFFNGQYIETVTHLPAGRALSAYAMVIHDGTADKLNYEAFLKANVGDFENKNARDIVNFEDDITRILGEMKICDKQILVEQVVVKFLQTYSVAVKLIHHEGINKMIFAGGVGQKFQSLQKHLASEFKMTTYIADTDESTLQGLSFLLARNK